MCRDIRNELDIFIGVSLLSCNTSTSIISSSCISISSVLVRGGSTQASQRLSVGNKHWSSASSESLEESRNRSSAVDPLLPHDATVLLLHLNLFKIDKIFRLFPTILSYYTSPKLGKDGKNTTVPNLSKLQPLTGANYRRWSEELLFFFQETGLEYVLIEDQTPPSLESGAPADDSVSAKLKEEVISTKKEGSFEEHNITCRGHIIRHLLEKLFKEKIRLRGYGSEDQGKKQYVTSR